MDERQKQARNTVAWWQVTTALPELAPSVSHPKSRVVTCLSRWSRPPPWGCSRCKSRGIAMVTVQALYSRRTHHMAIILDTYKDSIPSRPCASTARSSSHENLITDELIARALQAILDVCDADGRMKARAMREKTSPGHVCMPATTSSPRCGWLVRHAGRLVWLVRSTSFSRILQALCSCPPVEQNAYATW